jgi:hypothetical protein
VHRILYSEYDTRSKWHVWTGMFFELYTWFQNIITNILQTCCQKKVQSCKTQELCIKQLAAINYSSEEPATSTVQSKDPFSSACGFAIPSPWPSWFGIGPVIPQSNCAPPPPATTPSSTTAGIPGWPKHGGHGPVVIPKPTSRSAPVHNDESAKWYSYWIGQ